jgi:LPXTG-motif cell wall-anchored protein
VESQAPGGGGPDHHGDTANEQAQKAPSTAGTNEHLAATGSNNFVGLMAGIGAAMLALGGLILIYQRKRRADQAESGGIDG